MFRIAKTSLLLSITIHILAAVLTAMSYLIILFLLKIFYE